MKVHEVVEVGEVEEHKRYRVTARRGGGLTEVGAGETNRRRAVRTDTE